jgi:tetratricopeptide (TPR) repeat protein
MRPLATWSLVVVVALAIPSAAWAGDADGPDLDKEISFGVKMAKRGLWSEALFRFKRAAEQRPNEAKILNNLAVAYEAVGQYDNALLAYKEALKADSTNRELKRNYSRFIEFYQAYKPAGEPASEDLEAQQETMEPSEPPSSPSGQ